MATDTDDMGEPGDGWGENSRYAAHLDRGWSLLDQGQLEAARASAEHARELKPDAPDAEVLIGAVALAEGDAVAALQAYERAIEADPEYLEPYVAAAQVCLFDLGEPERALALADEALELDPVGPIEALDLGLLATEAELVLDRRADAEHRMDALEGLPVLRAALDHDPEDGDANRDPEAAEDPALADALHFLYRDAEGEPLEDEEQTDVRQRLLQLVLRASRLWIDLGKPSHALPLLRQTSQRFPGEPDAWYALNEAELAAGDPRRAIQAAVQVHRLDAHLAEAPQSPSPADLHRQVVEVLQSCEDLVLTRHLQAAAPLVVLVHEMPSLELVLEGVDPRVPALALATRAPDEAPERPPILTGLAVYRRNLARFARDEEQAADEVRYAVLDELAAFFQLDAEQRAALGLEPPPEPAWSAGPGGTSTSTVAAEPEPAEPERPRERRRRRKRLN
jgi:tetratricopeptide (TPR) repeat protein